jgi:hypothetical protein
MASIADAHRTIARRLKGKRALERAKLKWTLEQQGVGVQSDDGLL